MGRDRVVRYSSGEDGGNVRERGICVKSKFRKGNSARVSQVAVAVRNGSLVAVKRGEAFLVRLCKIQEYI